jgi:D-glycero-alpha-D-manno-heptose-7-phosphate kinase
MLIVQTPLRVSFLGGGTDFDDFSHDHGGTVLSTAIDKYATVFIKERSDDLIYVNYRKKEIVAKVDDIKHELVREAMRLTGIEKGIEISTFVDVREGSGLGSSSSITVGLLHALYTYKGEVRDTDTLARQACQIEINTLGKPIGRQDQYIAAYGGFRFITFHNSGVTVENIDLSPELKRRLSERLLLFFTGRTRKSEDILTEQKANIKERLHLLKELKDMAHRGKELIVEGKLDDFGKLLNEGWLCKRRLASKVSDGELDEMYEAALKAGTLGGKICGAGGGGFLLLFCPPERRDGVRSALRRLEEIPFHLERGGSRVVFNYRRA